MKSKDSTILMIILFILFIVFMYILFVKKESLLPVPNGEWEKKQTAFTNSKNKLYEMAKEQCSDSKDPKDGTQSN